MADVLQRHLGAIRTLDPGQYCTAEGRVSICCPQCSSIDVLDAQTIDPAGRVARRYKCITEACPWSAYLVLESWSKP